MGAAWDVEPVERSSRAEAGRGGLVVRQEHLAAGPRRLAGSLAMVDPNQHDVFLMRQKLTAMINRYGFSLPGADGQPGELVAFVEGRR